MEEKKHKSMKNISIREYLIIHGKIVKDNPPTGKGPTSSDSSEKCGDSFKQPTLNHFITKMKKQHRRRATTPAKTGVPVSLVTRGVRKKASSDGRHSSQAQDKKGIQCPNEAGVLCAVDANMQPQPMACGIASKLSKISHAGLGDEMFDNQWCPSASAHDRQQAKPRARVPDRGTTCKENCGQCESPETIPQDCPEAMGPLDRGHGPEAVGIGPLDRDHGPEAMGIGPLDDGGHRYLSPKTFRTNCKDRENVSRPFRKPLDSAKSARRNRLKLNRRPKATRGGRVPNSRPEATGNPVINEVGESLYNTKSKIPSSCCISSSGSGLKESVSLPPAPKHHTSSLPSPPKDKRINYTDTEELLAELSYCEKIKI